MFKKCAACHNADKGGANQLGPNLWGVLGEPIGQGQGFAFSDALAKKGGTWNWDNLSEWLTSPKAFAPGTKMTFAGLSNPQDRANVIAFLNRIATRRCRCRRRRCCARPTAAPTKPAQAAGERADRAEGGQGAHERRRRSAVNGGRPGSRQAALSAAHSGGPA